MPEESEDKKSRRNVMKLCGSSLATTGVLFGLSSSASARSQPDFDPHSQEETLEFIKRHAQTSEKEAKKTWKRLSDDQKYVIKEFTDVDQITHKVDEEEPDAITTNSSYQTKQITHTVVSTTEVPLVGWDLVDIWAFKQKVVWDYNGSNYKNVNHSDSAEIRFPQISFWRYDGIQDKNIANQSSWARASMSGKFRFRFFQYGSIRSQTAFSKVKVYPNGTWEITEENVQ